jgi:osmotically-inducible protein OsmY
MKLKNFPMIMILVACIAFTVSCKSKSDDATILTNVTNSLANRPGITATVNDGVVTLTGTCPDEDCKKNAEDAVKSVKDVKSVVNNITIVTVEQSAPVTITPDEALKSSVGDVVKNYKDVQADVNDGVVTLRGQISRDDLQKLIMSLNELHPKSIKNELVIK